MKKNIFLTLILVAVATFSFGQNLATSAHDFSDADAWNTLTGNKMCGTCHAPHNNLNAAGTLLWSHNPSTAVGTYIPYTNPSTMDAATGQPANTSLLCLSCHDAAINVDAHYGGANLTGIAAINAAANVGTDLSTSHPVSFTYDAALATADGGLYDPTATASGVGAGNIDDDLLFNLTEVECSSCHDVHNAYNVAKLLVKSNTNSELCLTCHNK